MKINSLIKFPLHFILLPVFFVWHVYNEYLVLIQPFLYLTYLAYYSLLALALFGTGKLIYKNNSKAACWATILLIIFFFWGSAHDFLKNLSLPGFLVSYKFLFALVFIFLLVYSYFLARKKVPVKLNRFLNLLFLILVFVELFTTIFQLAGKQDRKKDWAYYNAPLPIKSTPVPDGQKPDIFFIVFDEYTSSKALKKYFNFDNSKLDSLLTGNGFFISTGSQSNYSSTTLSIASTFNLQYFNAPLESQPNDAATILKGAYSIDKSFLPAYLGNQGYRIINLGLFDIGDHSVAAEQGLEEYKVKALTLETLWGRIQRDIYWNITVRMPGYTGKMAPDMKYIQRNRDNFSHFIQELKKEDSSPRFVISHLLLPRRPLYVDRYGQPRYSTMVDYEDQHHDSLYIEQLIYANSLIDSIAKAVQSPHKRPRVLIMEGDHGNRYSKEGWNIREKHFMNLNAYYFSNSSYAQLYDNISPVNSFRVVLNNYFNAHLPMLKDSTILLN